MDCRQKHLYPYQGLTAVSITDTKRLKLQLSFIDNQMCGLLFVARNFSRFLLISFDLHSTAEFLDGRRVVDVVDKVDHHKNLFLLILKRSSSFSSNHLLILLTADPSSQRL